LFYKEIIQVPPENWVRTFVSEGPATDQFTVRKDLAIEYFRNHITESYLVAAKVADKLRYLMPAQEILAWSLRILLIWIVVGSVTFAIVPEQPKPTASAIPAVTVNPKPQEAGAPGQKRP
jgi:hypothetical protein